MTNLKETEMKPYKTNFAYTSSFDFTKSSFFMRSEFFGDESLSKFTDRACHQIVDRVNTYDGYGYLQCDDIREFVMRNVCKLRTFEEENIKVFDHTECLDLKKLNLKLYINLLKKSQISLSQFRYTFKKYEETKSE